MSRSKPVHIHHKEEMVMGMIFTLNLPVVTAIISAFEFIAANEKEFKTFTGCDKCVATCKEGIAAFKKVAEDAIKERKLGEGSNNKN